MSEFVADLVRQTTGKFNRLLFSTKHFAIRLSCYSQTIGHLANNTNSR